MKTLSVSEMRNKLGELDKLLAQEKEIIVTRHNIHLARILPVKGKKKRPDHKALRESLAVSGYCRRDVAANGKG